MNVPVSADSAETSLVLLATAIGTSTLAGFCGSEGFSHSEALNVRSSISTNPIFSVFPAALSLLFSPTRRVLVLSWGSGSLLSLK